MLILPLLPHDEYIIQSIMPPKSKSKSANIRSKTLSAAEEQQANTKKNNKSIISWPPLRPLLPSSSLYLSTEIPDQIYLIRNLFLPALCKSYINFFLSSNIPLITTPAKPKRGDAVRVNDRFQVDDRGFANMLWEMSGLKDVVGRYLEEEEEEEEEEELLEGKNGDDDDDRRRKKRNINAKKLFGGEPLGLNPNIRIYRYSKGQFFAKHCMYDCLAHMCSYIYIDRLRSPLR